MKACVKVSICGTYALDESYGDGYSGARERFDSAMRPRYGLYDGGGYLKYLTAKDRQGEDAFGTRRGGVPFDMRGKELSEERIREMSERAKANGSSVCYGNVKLYAPYDGYRSAGKWRRLVSSVFPTFFLSLGMDPGNVDAVFVAHTRDDHPAHVHFVFWERRADRLTSRGRKRRYTPFPEIRRGKETLGRLTAAYLSSRGRGEAESPEEAAAAIRNAGKAAVAVARKDIKLELLDIAGDMYRDCLKAGWRPPARRAEGASVGEEAGKERRAPGTGGVSPSPGSVPGSRAPGPGGAGRTHVLSREVAAEWKWIGIPVAGEARKDTERKPYVRICDAVPLDRDRYRPKARKVLEDMFLLDDGFRQGESRAEASEARSRDRIRSEGDDEDMGRIDSLREGYERKKEDFVLEYASLLADTITPYGDPIAVGRGKGRAREIKLDYRRRYADRFFENAGPVLGGEAEDVAMKMEAAADESVERKRDLETALAWERFLRELEEREKEYERIIAEMERKASEKKREEPGRSAWDTTPEVDLEPPDRMRSRREEKRDIDEWVMEKEKVRRYDGRSR